MNKTGLVVKSTGSWIIVKSGNTKINCKVKGKFRVEGIKATNPVAVGDWVDFQLVDNDDTGFITRVHNRENYIIRKSINLSKQIHIIAANIDQAFLMVSMVLPKTLTGFIDRFLITMEAYRIPAIILFNKTDIYKAKHNDEADKLIEIYENAGYRCIKISATQNVNIEEIKTLICNKVSVISGNSGVGKTTLINTIEPALSLKTNEISQLHKAGKHTTTFAEMFDLESGGSIIDTPGIKGFGVVDIETDKQISHYFPEMFKLIQHCKFHNCSHTHEPGCAVKQAVEDGEISFSRYKNYLDILDDGQQKYRI